MYTLSCLCLSPVLQSLTEKDDLYPEEYKLACSSSPNPQFPVDTQHHCQVAALRDSVSLVTTDHQLYEYKCPSHTAEELRQISTITSRMEWRGLNDTKVYSSVMDAAVAEHIDRYNTYCSGQGPHSKL